MIKDLILSHKFIYAWTSVEVCGKPIYAEAKVELLVVSSAHNLGLDKITQNNALMS